MVQSTGSQGSQLAILNYLEGIYFQIPSIKKRQFWIKNVWTFWRIENFWFLNLRLNFKIWSLIFEFWVWISFWVLELWILTFGFWILNSTFELGTLIEVWFLNFLNVLQFLKSQFFGRFEFWGFHIFSLYDSTYKTSTYLEDTCIRGTLALENKYGYHRIVF